MAFDSNDAADSTGATASDEWAQMVLRSRKRCLGMKLMGKGVVTVCCSCMIPFFSANTAGFFSVIVGDQSISRRMSAKLLRITGS
jgi:hypothetical protein